MIANKNGSERKIIEMSSWLPRVRKYYAGEVHCHSKLSDRKDMGGNKEVGVLSACLVATYASLLGLDFLVFTEHASNTRAPHRLPYDHPICQSLLIQRDLNDDLRRRIVLGIYSGVEASIVPTENGSCFLDVPDSILKEMDIVIASRHGFLHGEKDPEMIKKSLMAAILNPYVRIIGHPLRHIEFYPHSWDYFLEYLKNINSRDSVEFLQLAHDTAKESGDWRFVKVVIGKRDLQKGETHIYSKYNRDFERLQAEYWQVWDEVLKAMVKYCKVFEINLNSFLPHKNFFQIFMEKAAAYDDLQFSISFDFHNIKQQRYMVKHNDNVEIEGVMSKSRARAIKRLLDLIDLFEKNGVGPDRIINSSKERFESFLNH